MTATLMPKSEPTTAALSRRESQVMDILHRRSRRHRRRDHGRSPGSADLFRCPIRSADPRREGADPHKEDGPRYVYYPAKPTETAREDVLAHVVRTYFGDSPEQAVTALLRMSDVDLSDADVKRLRNTIRRARQSGR